MIEFIYEIRWNQGQLFILDIVEEPAMAPERRALPIGRD